MATEKAKKKHFEPVRKDWLPYGRQTVDEEDVNSVIDALRSDWLTQGPRVKRFESEFAAYVGAKHAIAFCNGTDALLAAYKAAGAGPENEIVTTTMTFAATANAALLAGAKVRFCDIDYNTGLMDPSSLAEVTTETVCAVVPVHYGGGCCDMEKINELAKEKNALVIEDACHALGAGYKGRKAGTLADMSVFSFHPVKPITTAEGGIVTTDNEQLAGTLTALATHGIIKDDSCAQVGPWYYEVRSLSGNGRLSDVHAALGLSQLGKAESFLGKRRRLAKVYDEQLKGNGFFRPLHIPEWTRSAYHLYPVLVDTGRLVCSKKELVEALHRMNIGVQVHYIPVHRHPLYKKMGFTDDGLTNAVRFYESEISLPLFPRMTDSDINDVLTALGKVAEAYAR